MQPNVIDVSHWNKVEDFYALKSQGIQAVIFKATEGNHYHDDTFLDGVKRCVAAGLLVGAYHWVNAQSDPEEQVEFFLDFVKQAALSATIDQIKLCVDWETDAKRGTMSLDNVAKFCELIHEKTGQWPALYSGNVVKEHLGDGTHEVLKKCQLWLAQYSTTPKVPANWDSYWLWQFSETGVLKGIPGGKVDLNVYSGDDLAGSWILKDEKTSVGEIATGIGGTIVAFSATDWITATIVVAILVGILVWYWKKK